MKILIYDPPSGWKYGFPKPYKPLPSETLEQTLLRDGYPQEEINAGGAEHVRFWEHEEAEFCLYCGAGIGVHRRAGEGTCWKCKDK